MDATDAGPARRSGRERKPIERLSMGSSQPTKKPKTARKSTEGRRKSHAASDEDDDEGEDDDDEGEDHSEIEQEEEDQAEEEDSGTEPEHSSDEEFGAPKSSKRQSRASNPKPSATNGNQKTSPKATRKPASTKAAKPRAPRKAANGTGGGKGASEAGPVGKGDFVIEEDNGIFNAVRNPNAALETVVDDWVQAYQDDSGSAMAELVNFVLRTCGCNATIDEHQAADNDGIVDVLEDIQDSFKKEALLAYPVVSKSKTYKKFRTSLTSFLSRLFASTAASELLYDDEFCQLFQSWLVSLSSSQIRSFRHTATVIALASVSALNEVAVEVDKEFGQASRAKEAEEKKGRKDKARLKALDKNVNEVHVRKTKLEEYLTELFDSVFVHRYRDSESIIRTECIKALGGWMKVYPDYWLEGNYLRYIGWVLSDEHKDVRLESVKALTSLYAKDDHIGAMQHFTDRFKGQLVRMATGEIDLSVRIACIHVLRQIDKHGLLEPEQTDRIAMLVFEAEKRVRQAVAAFFDGLLDEAVQERESELDADRAGAKNKTAVGVAAKDQLRFKCLAELLVKHGRALDGVEDAAEDEEESEGDSGKADVVEQVRSHRGRVAFAVEALWEQVPAIRGWRSILEFLLLDHTTTSTKQKGKGAKPSGGEVDEACRLSEDEETLLVEVLVASLGKTLGGTGKDKNADEDVEQASLVIIDALPRLFTKHQTIPTRVVDILSIPTLISLKLYHDMDKLEAYESLWESVQKQFTSHTDSRVLDQAVKTLRVFLDTSALSNINAAKLAELKDSLVTSLRETVEGKDVEASVFEEDELLTLSAWVSRLNKLCAAFDISDSLDETDEGGAGSAWDIIDALASRGGLGYTDEAPMMEHALAILNQHLLWRFVALAREPGEPDAVALTSIGERRGSLLERLESYSVGTSTNAVESVKLCALTLLLELYVFSDNIANADRDPDGRFSELRVECSDELQARCAGFIEAEIERYSESLRDEEDQEDSETAQGGSSDDDDDDDDDAEDRAETDKTKKGKKASFKKGRRARAPAEKASANEDLTPAAIRAANVKAEARLIAAGQFDRAMIAFVRAIHGGIFDLRHASVILIRYEHFGPTYDQFARLLVNDLRDEGIYGTSSEAVSHIVVESLQSACDLLVDQANVDEERLIGLARLLAHAVVVRGAQLAIVKSMPTEHHTYVHTATASYAIKKLAGFEEARKKEARNKTLVLFKALANLLVGLNGKAALKIKTHLDSALDGSNLVVPASGKTWEPLRSYQKRLLTAMSKDPNIKDAAVKSAKRKAAAVSTDDEELDVNGDATEDDEQDEAGEALSASRPQSRPRPRRVTRDGTKQHASDSDSEQEQDIVTSPRQERQAITARPSNGAAAKKRKIASPVDDVDAEDNDEVESILRPDSRSPTKRSRSSGSENEEGVLDDEDGEDGDALDGGDDNAEDEEATANEATATSSQVSRPPASNASQVSLSDIKRKKKKARR